MKKLGGDLIPNQIVVQEGASGPPVQRHIFDVEKQIYIGHLNMADFFLVYSAEGIPFNRHCWSVIKQLDTSRKLNIIYRLEKFTRKNLKGRYDSILPKAQAIAKLVGIEHNFLSH